MKAKFSSVAANDKIPSVDLNSNGELRRREVASGATVTLNGNSSTLSAAQAGDVIECSGQPATTVKITR